MAGFRAMFDAFYCLVPTSHGPLLQLGWRRRKGKMPLAPPRGLILPCLGSGGDEGGRSLQGAETAGPARHLTWPGWRSIGEKRRVSCPCASSLQGDTDRGDHPAPPALLPGTRGQTG